MWFQIIAINVVGGGELEKGKITKQQYDQKEAAHVGECQCNFEELSGKMEAEAAKVTWARSVALNKMRYTVFISDGDSSAYKSVCELDP